jgi:hypothetical protein
MWEGSLDRNTDSVCCGRRETWTSKGLCVEDQSLLQSYACLRVNSFPTFRRTFMESRQSCTIIIYFSVNWIRKVNTIEFALCLLLGSKDVTLLFNIVWVKVSASLASRPQRPANHETSYRPSECSFLNNGMSRACRTLLITWRITSRHSLSYKWREPPPPSPSIRTLQYPGHSTSLIRVCCAFLYVLHFFSNPYQFSTHDYMPQRTLAGYKLNTFKMTSCWRTYSIF